MRTWERAIAVAAILAMTSWPPQAVAEEAETHAPPTSRRIDEAKPPLYYLKDKNGVLQPVPGFSLEEFERLYKVDHDLAPREERPSYSIQRIAVTGGVNGEHADLTIRVGVQVREAHWVRVPLRFDRGLLEEVAEYRGPGEQFLHFEPEGDGYVSWIRGEAGQHHEIIVKMLVPLGATGDETRLRLTVPRATASEMEFEVPLANAIGRVSERATLERVTSTGSMTKFTVRGLSGDFEIAWRAPGGSESGALPLLEASAAILTRIDARNIDTDAYLTVRSHGAPFDTFRVQLPPQSELVPSGDTTYTVSMIESVDKNQRGLPTVEVRLAKKTSGPVEVHLTTRRPPFSPESDAWTELAGFEVTGAARQWGTLAITAMNDWQILWGQSRSVRQSEQVPEIVRRDDIVAAFDYFAQPFSLTARMVPKKTRVHVEPEYRLSIDPDLASLDARLKFVLRGAKVSSLEVGIPGWQLDDVGPETVVATDGVSMGEGNVVHIPLIQPATGPVEIRLRAHRSLDDKTIALEMPRPKANSASPAAVVISSADNIQLVPDAARTQGLVREQIPPQLALPDRRQLPLFYRSEASQATFAAEVRTHARYLSAEISTDLRLEETNAVVEQRFRLGVSHEPTDSLMVLVPAQLASSDDLEFEYDGRPVAAVPVVPDLSKADAGESTLRQYQVLLPGPVIGSCQLEVRFSLPIAAVTAGNRVVVSVPLVAPLADRCRANRITVTSARRLAAQPAAGPWTRSSRVPKLTSTHRVVEWATESTPESVELSLQYDQSLAGGATVVDRQWIQTWLTSASRQDRFVARFSTSLAAVDVTLPAGAVVGQASAVLDGTRLVNVGTQDNALTIPLSGDPSTMHVLEVRYHFTEARPPRGSMAIDFPCIGPDGWVRRTYWQLILPNDEHVLLTPSGFMSEATIAWCGYFWGRKPLMDQAELETWCGVPVRGPVLPSANSYLFGSLGQLETATFHTAGRAWIVFFASAAALGLALLIVYVPVVRHPTNLMVLSVLLAAGGLAYPEVALLLAEAASLGVVLAGVSIVLARRLNRPSTIVGPVLPESLSGHTRRGPPPSVRSGISTRTLPAAEPASSEPLE